jgi:hypothetical protein
MLGFLSLVFEEGLWLKKVLKVQKSKTVLFTISQAPGQVKSPRFARVNPSRPAWAWHPGLLWRFRVSQASLFCCRLQQAFPLELGPGAFGRLIFMLSCLCCFI